jgi:hypothetical protein
MGLEGVQRRLAREVVKGKTLWFSPCEAVASRRSLPTAHLLPIYDEYVSGYKDRSAMINARNGALLVAMGNALSHIVVVGGHIVGTWKRRFDRGGVVIKTAIFHRLTRAQDRAVRAAIQAHGDFLGMSVRLESGPATYFGDERRLVGPRAPDDRNNAPVRRPLPQVLDGVLTPVALPLFAMYSSHAQGHDAIVVAPTGPHSHLQPPAGVAAFVDFHGLSSEEPTPALLDNAGVGTDSVTQEQRPDASPRLSIDEVRESPTSLSWAIVRERLVMLRWNVHPAPGGRLTPRPRRRSPSSHASSVMRLSGRHD